MKILLTGANGLLGSEFLNKCPSESEITAVVRQIATSKLPGSVSLIEADLSEPEFIDSSWPTSVDAVVHLAYAPASDNVDSQREAFSVNTVATLNLIQYAIEAGASQFVFASSGSVYPESDEYITEQNDVNPTDFYGATKLAAETIATAFTENIDVKILRLFNLYGPDARHGLVAQLISRISTDQEVSVARGVGMRTTPTHITDAATVLQRCLNFSGSYTVNVAGPESINVRQLANLIAEAMNRSVNFLRTEAPPVMDRMGKSFRLAQLIGYSPATDLKSGIASVLESTPGAPNTIHPEDN